MIQPFSQTPLQWVGEDGVPVQPLPSRYTPDFLRQLYRDMLRAREFDQKLITLLRQGRTSFYSQASGMEATQVGLAHSVRSGHDWIWPYYRDHPVGLAHPPAHHFVHHPVHPLLRGAGVVSPSFAHRAVSHLLLCAHGCL